jgi:ketosteroid isomerase-like protein
MISRISVLAFSMLVGLLLLGGKVIAQAEQEVKDKTVKELKTLENEWAQAFVKNDAEAIGGFMANDWIVIGSDGSVIDRASFLGIIKSGMLTHDVMRADDMKVRVYGDTAVVTARSTSKGKFNGQVFSELERSSDVFVKQNGQWKCVLTHLTKIAEK